MDLLCCDDFFLYYADYGRKFSYNLYRIPYEVIDKRFRDIYG